MHPNLHTHMCRLSQDLCAAGLVLSPGEANGLQLPGRFIVSSPLVQQDGVVAQFIQKLMKVGIHVHMYI